MLLRVHDIIVWLPFFVLYLLGYARGHLLSFLASHKPRECSALIMIPLLLCDRTQDEQAQDMARIKYFERSRLVHVGYNTAEPILVLARRRKETRRRRRTCSSRRTNMGKQPALRRPCTGCPLRDDESCPTHHSTLVLLYIPLTSLPRCHISTLDKSPPSTPEQHQSSRVNDPRIFVESSFTVLWMSAYELVELFSYNTNHVITCVLYIR